MPKDKDILTTGDVARLCRVTIRTVIKWYEQGRLPGYRLPGSRDRRFTRIAVESFMRDNEIPIDLLDVKRPRVLVVDDDDGVRTMIARYLTSLGVLEVETAGSGWDAGLKTASWRPRVLLLDFQLGDTTGDKVLTTIRATEGVPQPAIIVMSAHLEQEQADELMENGADAFLPKPFELVTLRDLVLRHTGLVS